MVFLEGNGVDKLHRQHKRSGNVDVLAVQVEGIIDGIGDNLFSPKERQAADLRTLYGRQTYFHNKR
jgi:hypothetical protein